MHVIGIDPSFTNTGMIRLDEKFNILEKATVSTSSKKSVEERLIMLRSQIMTFVQLSGVPDKIVMEGIAFSKKSTFAAQLGALNFMMRVEFYDNNFNYVIVSPTELKQYVLGSEKKKYKKKEFMMMVAYKRWGVEFENNDLCDAYCLARKGVEDWHRLQAMELVPLRRRRK